MITTYDELFARATGHAAPHGYQRRIAESGLPALLEIPPGYGKTAAVVVGWLWRRRFHPEMAVRSDTSRRLILALPQRALVDQSARQIELWLSRLEIPADDLALHVIMGGAGHASRPWRAAPDVDSILVGTSDMITSKALVRGYGVPRNAFPMDAALVWNDAHIVVDEVQLAPASTVTLRQIEGFRRARPTATSRLTCMSATVPGELIDTVDNPFPEPDQIIRLGPDDDSEELQRRRGARRTIRELRDAPTDPKRIAEHALERHRARRLTLVIVNTVKAAREVARAIDRALHTSTPGVEVVLLHSQFRPVDRAPKITSLTATPPEAGRIVVATQVVEAGIDVDADVVVTEVAPWHSIVQRSGRCNRAGRTDDAELWWTEPSRAAPYDADDVRESAATLRAFEGQQVTNEQLLEAQVTTKPVEPLTLRRSDFAGLFDTMPDLSGHDLDIAPYVRDVDELSLQLCWLEWEGTVPPETLKLPPPDYRCRVPLGAAADLTKAGKNVWRLDPFDARWRTVDRQSPARPGEVLLVKASEGGYRVEVGFDATAKAPVPVEPMAPDSPVDDAVISEDAMTDDHRSFCPTWIPLEQHLRETAEEAANLVAKLDLPDAEKTDTVLAAKIHDIGKAHPTWQDAICGTADEDEKASVEGGRPWAKSKHSARHLRYDGADAFRHELASVLLLDGPMSGLLDGANDADLVRYLVLAHHGKLRVQIRDPKPVRDSLLGLKEGAEITVPSVLGQPEGVMRTSLARVGLHGDPEAGIPGWADLVAGLLTRYGAFRLAYLETLVRVADWRASARHDKGGRAQ